MQQIESNMGWGMFLSALWAVSMLPLKWWPRHNKFFRKWSVKPCLYRQTHELNYMFYAASSSCAVRNLTSCFFIWTLPPAEGLFCKHLPLVTVLPRSEKNKAIVIWNVRDLRMSRWFCSCHRGRPAKTSRGWRWRRRWGVLNRRHGLLAEAPYIFRFVSFYFSISDFSAGEWASGVVVHNSFELNRVSFCSGIEAQS